MQLFTYETMSENIDLTDTERLLGEFTVKRRTSTQLFDLQRRLSVKFSQEGRVCMQHVT